MLVPAVFQSFYHNYTLRQTADTFETINRHLRGRLRVVPHFSLGTVEQVKRECTWKSPHARKAVGREKNEGVQTKPKLLTLHGWPILACEVRIPLPNQLSTSNGIPSLTELSLLLSSVNCGGYLLQAKENPDTNFLYGNFAWITW